MHLQITSNKYKGKVTRYAKIVESYKEPGKTTRKRLILNLGPIKDSSDEEKFKQIVKKMNLGKQFVDINSIHIKDSKEFGVTYLTTKLLEKYGLEKILNQYLSKNKATFNVYNIIKALIINRLIKPSSDLSAADWIIKHYPEETKVEEQYIYRALSYLIEHKTEIEYETFNTLKKKLNLDLTKTFYDLTSSYVDGQKCELAMFGYSRDKRRDRKQIVLGLVMCDGIPIMHDVYEGNTKDSTTLEQMQERLNELGITQTTVLADSGLMTATNIIMLEDKGVQYVLGVPRRNNKKAQQYLVEEIEIKENQGACEIGCETTERDGKTIKRRYLLCLDQNTQKERLATLEQIKKRIEKKLKELQEKYKKNQKAKKGKKITRDSLMAQARTILGKNKRIFNIEFDKGLSFSLKNENWDYEKKIAGKFLLITNSNIDANEAMKSYKKLQVVENAFDEIKNFLNIRPVYHWKKQMVKAHVFICILAFLVECLIERSCKQTARKVINELETVKLIGMKTKKIHKKIITELSSETKSLLKEMKIPNPLLIE